MPWEFLFFVTPLIAGSGGVDLRCTGSEHFHVSPCLRISCLRSPDLTRARAKPDFDCLQGVKGYIS